MHTGKLKISERDIAGIWSPVDQAKINCLVTKIVCIFEFKIQYTILEFLAIKEIAFLERKFAKEKKSM